MDTLTVRQRSQVMARVRSRENKATEILMLGLLRKNKITGWRRHANIFGKPDFVFCSLRVALFVDGCFWHGCVRHYRMPISNRVYWRKKVARNVMRDRRVNRALRQDGWTVVRIWEHEFKNEKRVLLKLLRTGVKGKAPIADFVAKRKNPAADTCASKRDMDQQVYALYSLTPEEIKIVGEATK